MGSMLQECTIRGHTPRETSSPVGSSLLFEQWNKTRASNLNPHCEEGTLGPRILLSQASKIGLARAGFLHRKTIQLPSLPSSRTCWLQTCCCIIGMWIARQQRQTEWEHET